MQRLATKVVTQCPQCGGRFEVSMAQLQLRKGFVRCVHCAHIFDGYETVVPQASLAAQLPVQTPAQAQTRTHMQTPHSPAVIRQRHSVTLPDTAPDDGDSVHEEAFSISDPVPESVDDEPAWRLDEDDARTRIRSSDPIYAERRIAPAPAPATLQDPAPQRVWVLWIWGLLDTLALIVLLAQLAVIYRVQIADQFPATRPVLERLCGAWGCQLDYPRRLDQLAILSSSLRMQPRTDQGTDADGLLRLTLYVTLRNQDQRTQQWPTLRLDLTDVSGAVVIRKHLSPTDYLPTALADQPFAGRSELALRLPMQVQDVAVSGYQIHPFFP